MNRSNFGNHLIITIATLLVLWLKLYEKIAGFLNRVVVQKIFLHHNEHLLKFGVFRSVQCCEAKYLRTLFKRILLHGHSMVIQI